MAMPICNRSVIARPQQVTTEAKEIVDGGMKAEKQLSVTGRFESAHLSFSLANRLMGGFHSIVGVPLRAVRCLEKHRSHCCRVTS
jgi:hypothetical protein